MLTVWDTYSIPNWEGLIKGPGAALSVCICVGSKSHFLVPESDPSLLPLPLFSSGLQKPPGREAIKTSEQVAIFSSHSLLVKRTWPGNWVQYPPFPTLPLRFPPNPWTWAGSSLPCLKNEWTTLSNTASSSNFLLIILKWLVITLLAMANQILHDLALLSRTPTSHPFTQTHHAHMPLRAIAPAVPAPQDADLKPLNTCFLSMHYVLAWLWSVHRVLLWSVYTN